ncbi:MAG: hypothetical protein Q7U39_18000 [Nitrospira sp.]|nr:hypothetical protein [Nitrospira sp.]
MRPILLASALTWIVAVLPAVAGAADEVTERAVPNSSMIVQQPAQPSGTTIPPLTVDQRLAAMQQQIQALQMQVSALQAIVNITPSAVTIHSNGSLVIQAAKGVSIGAGQNVAIQSNGGVLVEGKGPLDLKAPLITMNGGTKPLATVGSAVGNGKVLTGSGTILGN